MTTATVLFAHGVTNIATAADAAKKTKPDYSAWWVRLNSLREQYPLGYTMPDDGLLSPQQIIQRIAREGFDIATASDTDINLKLRDWSLAVLPGSAAGQGNSSISTRYTAELPANDFGLKLQFTETQPVLLQGRLVISLPSRPPARSISVKAKHSCSAPWSA